MVILELDNVYLKIIGMTKTQEYSLWKILSFRVEVFGVPEVRYRHLFNRVTKKTYAGLVKHVENFCKEYGIAYQLNDLREKPERNQNYSLVKEINGNPLEMRAYQKEIVDRCEERETIQAATGAGKAMPLDTPVLTPEGFVPLADIHIGSTVIDGLGAHTKVIGEYPQGKKCEWLVKFDDGSSITCCDEHLWKFMFQDENHQGEWEVASIRQILDKYDLKNLNRSYTLSIPICHSVEFGNHDLPISSYILGRLLGDSKFEFNKLVTFDILDRSTIYLIETFKNAQEKFVPDEYLFSSF